ncbi:hypothetical protein GALL_403270 [mine drainage metagenome]|uniref:Uncharacterized protein n=1 Tax=mine drainage metagenome TaxID=410659 RepID=A0A1J5Q3V1_9ZZZZ
MSYLNEWRAAWSDAAESVELINVLKTSDVDRFKKELLSFDLIVILHSMNADSNAWLPRVQTPLSNRRCPLVMFVGNEYSNPWLSMELRLAHIKSVYPEIIATQINIEPAQWLYRGTTKKVAAAPHGLPTGVKPSDAVHRSIDFGARGFRYPWYLLDQERNNILEAVEDSVRAVGGFVDSSQSQRFNQLDWYRFLRSTKISASSEAGSRFVFDTDEIWIPALRRLSQESGAFDAISNDARGMALARRLPAPLKSLLRKFAQTIGVEQGSTADLDQALSIELRSLTKIDQFPHVDGKALSSRHLDAIATGTWQILQPGRYNEVLVPGVHFSSWDPGKGAEIVSDALEAFRDGRAENAYLTLEANHSYGSRVQDILNSLNELGE